MWATFLCFIDLFSTSQNPKPHAMQNSQHIPPPLFPKMQHPYPLTIKPPTNLCSVQAKIYGGLFTLFYRVLPTPCGHISTNCKHTKPYNCGVTSTDTGSEACPMRFKPPNRQQTPTNRHQFGAWQRGTEVFSSKFLSHLIRSSAFAGKKYFFMFDEI